MEKTANININVFRNNAVISYHRDGTDGVYAYYLNRVDTGTVEKTGYSSDTTHHFRLDVSGVYWVKVFYKIDGEKYTEESDFFDFISNEDKEAFEAFCLTPPHPMMLPDVPALYHRCEPYPLFFCVKGDTIDSVSLERVTASLGFQLQHHETMTDCYIGADRNSVPDLLLSGIAQHDGQLIFGNDEEIPAGCCSDTTIGTFTYYRIQGDMIEVGTDYFGIGKLYYYDTGNFFVCSNGYHLILLLLRSLGVSLSMDLDVFIASCAKQFALTHMRFSDRCEVARVRVLSVYEKVRFSKNDVDLIKKKLFDDMKLSSGPISKEHYISLLSDAKDEVIDNIHSALNRKDIDRIVFDLTGGVDSRTNFAALMNFEHDCRIQLDAEDKFFGEHHFSKEIAKDSGYPFLTHDCQTDREGFDSKRFEDYLSQFVLEGVYETFVWPTDRGISYGNKAMKISGFFGESILRPFYSRTLLCEAGSQAFSRRDVIQRVLGKNGILSSDACHTLSTLISETLQEIPVDTALEQYELHYLFYRNRYHFGKWQGWNRWFRYIWSGLQSVSMFRLNRQVYWQKLDFKPNLELIALLNEDVASYPFYKEKDNIAKEEVWPQLLYKEPESLYRERQSLVCDDAEGDSISPIEYTEPDLKAVWKEQFLSVFFALMQWNDGILKQRIGYMIWVCYQRNRGGNHIIQTVYLKLVSFYLQLRMIDPMFDRFCREIQEECA